MKLAAYTGRPQGPRRIVNDLVALRLRSRITHCEIVWEPTDNAADLMPDSSVQPVDGAFWCASASALDRMPEWSARRAGRIGGVRLKRIALAPERWALIDLPAAQARPAAQWMRQHEGARYDWRGVLGFLAWPLGEGADDYMCSEACAAALGFERPWAIDPPLMARIAERLCKETP